MSQSGKFSVVSTFGPLNEIPSGIREKARQLLPEEVFEELNRRGDKGDFDRAIRTYRARKGA